VIDRVHGVVQFFAGRVALAKFRERDAAPGAAAVVWIEHGEAARGRGTRTVDVRVVAATNKDLEHAIKNGAFREDLFYRLKVIHIRMAALRAVRKDIPLLANHFLNIYCRELNKQPLAFTAEAMQCLKETRWPGNVRELENEVKLLVVCVTGPSITPDDLSDSIRDHAAGATTDAAELPTALKDAVGELEKRRIAEVLETCQQNQLQAAKQLGLSREGLIKKMRRYGLRPQSHGPHARRSEADRTRKPT
jgi:DNA-binding NtrC family response regulator